MNWSARRKIVILFVVAICAVVFIGVPTYVKFYQAPSCSDQKQNQDELGVDCGGPCSLLCQALVEKPVIVWQRSFRIQPGIYSAVAYLQNANLSFGARNVFYVMRLYDKENVLIAERRGKGDILPGKVTPFFETNIQTGKALPVRTTFEFVEEPFWEKAASFPDIRITNKVLSRETTEPRLTADVQNAGFSAVDDTAMIAILYDTQGNAIAASRSIIGTIEGGETQQVVFSWREPFGVEVSEREIFAVTLPAR